MLYKEPILKIAKIANVYLSLQKLSNFTANVVDLNYTCYDKNHRHSVAPVIILHGLLSSKKSWTWMSEAINRDTGRMVINVDARNHGESPHYPQNTYIDMANDTARLIKKLELPKVTLLGHSMGGRTAIILSLLYPELVSSAIIVDISPISMPPHMINNFPHVLDAICRIHFKGVMSVDEAIRFAREQLHSSGITQTVVVNFVLKNIGVKPDKTIGWLPNVGVLREDFPTLFRFPYVPDKMFPGPTLFIKAERSDFLPLEDLTGIKDFFPQAQLKLIPGVSHNIQDENPSTLLKFATEFLMKYT